MAIPIELFRFRVARNNQEQRPQGEKLGIAQRQRVARQSNQLLPDDWTEQLGADEWSALKLNLAGSLAGAFAGGARSGARPNGRSAMPFPIGRSLSPGPSVGVGSRRLFYEFTSDIHFTVMVIFLDTTGGLNG
jgi:hypothetical protein